MALEMRKRMADSLYRCERSDAQNSAIETQTDKKNCGKQKITREHEQMRGDHDRFFRDNDTNITT